MTPEQELQILREAQPRIHSESPAFSPRLEDHYQKFKDLMRLFYVLIGITMVMTGWVTKISLTVGDHTDLFVERKALWKDLRTDLDTYKQANDQTVRAVNTTTEILKSTVQTNGERILSLEPKVSDMWFMKQHGIPNRADYFDRTGQEAPKREEAKNTQ